MKYSRMFSLIVLVVLLVLPQAAKAGTLLGGVRTGYLNSALYSDGKQGKTKNSFYVGVYKDKQLIPLLKITSGVEYLQLGGRDVGNVDYTFHTLSMPVSAKVKFGPVYGLAGVSPSFKLGTNSEGAGALEAKTFDYPLHLGVGFSFLIIAIEARYNWGMNDTFETGSLKTNYLQFGASLAF